MIRPLLAAIAIVLAFAGAEASANDRLLDARDAVRTRDFERAVRLWRAEAERGVPEAQFRLAAALRSGRGVRKDEREAIRWWKRAAEEGHAGAQYQLALAYARGRGVERDRAEALRWMRSAAAAGHPAAAKAEAEYADAVVLGTAESRVVLASESATELLHVAIERGDLDAVREALARSASLAASKAHPSALVVAARSGNAAITAEILRYGPELDARDALGSTALHLAAADDRVEIVRALASAGAKLDLRDSRGRTALMMAAALGHDRSVRALAERGAALDLALQSGDDALALARRGHHEETSQLLIRLGARDEPRATRRAPEMTMTSENDIAAPLVEAVLRRRENVVRQLLGRGHDPNERDRAGRTALMHAATLGDAGMIEALLGAGAAPDLRDPDGRTALSFAASTDAAASLDPLLDANASPDAADVRGWNGLHWAAKTGAHRVVPSLTSIGLKNDQVASDGVSPIELAAGEGHIDALDSLLRAHAPGSAAMHRALCRAVTARMSASVVRLLASDADPDASCEGTPALVIAASGGDATSLDALLAAGAHVAAQSDLQRTALHAAAASGSEPAIDRLLEHGADLDCRDAARNTPLHLAVAAGRVEAARHLIESGARTDARNAQGQTALTLARAARSGPLVQLLESRRRGGITGWLGLDSR